jgi:hypothetical protein
MTQPLADLANDVPVLGPIGVAVTTVGTTAAQVIGADAVRRGILFHNPGSVNLRIAPVGSTLVTAAGGILIYPGEEFELLEGDDNLFNVNCAWQAVADGGSNNALTIFNFTDNNPAQVTQNPLMQVNQTAQISSPAITQETALGTVSKSVIGANPMRRGILFHNPGSVVVGVCPANLVALIGAGSLTILPGQEKRILAKGRVRVNCGFNAIAQGGSNNDLTILEFL